MLWINIVWLVGLTSITGGILVLVWYFVGLILERLGFANIVFELLKMVVFFFLMPIAYIGLKLYIAQSDSGYLFSPTPAIVEVSRTIGMIWLAGAMVVFLCVIRGYSKQKKLASTAFECSKETLELFQELKLAVLGREDRLQIQQCYQCPTPYVEARPAPRIVLPVAKYTQEELRVILVHEMTHFKQKDLTLKYFMQFVMVIHYFNPLAWLLLSKIRKWSEFACDLRASKHVGGVNPYFEVIMRVVMENPLRSGLTSHLVHNRHELVERVKKLVRMNKMKKRSRWSVILVLCTAFMLSSTTVCAATVECADAYVTMEKQTAVEDSEELADIHGYRVYTEYGDTGRVTCVEGEVTEQTRGTYGFEWELPAGYRKYAPYVSCSEGMDLLVSVLVDPRDVTIRVGIEDSLGYRYYVEGTDTIVHTFVIQNDRRYRVYTQNNTSTDVYLAGTYITRE